MSYVTTKELLEKAQDGYYAVGAFNAENLEMVQAIITAAEELNSPVIIQTTPTTVRYCDQSLFYGMVKPLADKSKVPVALHLDHGESYDMVVKSLIAGYSSIMIDASKLPFEENVETVQKAVDIASRFGIPVEAELGKLAGKEDDVIGNENCYTEVDEAIEFVKRTGIDSLAVAIGTAHGVYKGKPVLNVERLEEINKVVDIPLVLHGASGLTNEQLRACIEKGINKINFATELRIAYTDGVKEYMAQNPKAFDPKKYNAVGRDRVIEQVKARIKVCGSVDKA